MLKKPIRKSPYWPTLDVDTEKDLLIVRWSAQVDAAMLEYYIEHECRWTKQDTKAMCREYHHPLEVAIMEDIVTLLFRGHVLSLNFTKNALHFWELVHDPNLDAWIQQQKRDQALPAEPATRGKTKLFLD